MILQTPTHVLTPGDPVFVTRPNDAELRCGVLSELDDRYAWLTYAYPARVVEALGHAGISTPSGIESDCEREYLISIDELAATPPDALGGHVYVWPQSDPFRVTLVIHDGPLPEGPATLEVWQIVPVDGAQWQPAARVPAPSTLLFTLAEFAEGLHEWSHAQPAGGSTAPRVSQRPELR